MMKKALSFMLALFVLFSFSVSEASELGALLGNITSLSSALMMRMLTVSVIGLKQTIWSSP